MDNATGKLHRALLTRRRRLFQTVLAGAAVVLSLGLRPAGAESMTLSAALAESACQRQVPANSPNPAVTALHIAASTPCRDVTVDATDAAASSPAAPLIPVVIGSGGTLTFLDRSMTLYASSFLVKHGGVLQAGTATAPVKNQITIVMAGNASASPAPQSTGNSPMVTTSNETANVRDITVMGELRLYGAKGVSAAPDGIGNDPATTPAFINTLTGTKSWTYLALPAGPSTYDDAENVSAPVPETVPDKTLTLARAVDWQVHDWVSVATTSFSSHQTEIVQVCAISSVANPDMTAGAITGATNPVSPAPIVISTTNAPATGARVTIAGVQGNLAANGTWTVTNISPTTFSLDGSTGSGVYTTGGTWKAADVSQLTLCNRLKHYHFGGPAPTPGFFPANTTQAVATGANPIDVSFQAKSFYDDSHRNYGIDERAEVALLSRNIKLTSLAGRSGDPNPFMGGHLAAMSHGAHAASVRLVGVEIEKFGQALVGRYPIHLHQLVDGNAVLIQDVSVHHGYNKCFVIHGTANAKFYNNVCVRTVGQGFYLEDGDNITGNQIMRNLIAGTMAANTSYSYPRRNGSLYWDGDNLQASHAETGPITNATNTSPIVITSPNNLVTGARVTVTGVSGDTAANGTWTVTSLDAGHFALQGSTGTKDFSPYSGTWTTSGLNVITGLARDAASGLIRVETQSALASGAQLTISGAKGNTTINGAWTVKNDNNSPASFLLENSAALSPAGYKADSATWVATGAITNATDASPIVITSANAPLSGAQVSIADVQGNSAANGSWTVTNTNNSSASFALESSTGSGAYGAHWQAVPVAITEATPASPIVITAASAPPTGARVSISGAQGNSAANGTWTVTNISPTTFSLNGSTGNGTYTAGGSWLSADTSSDWYTVKAIPDASFSGANAPPSSAYQYGPDLFHPGGFWITNPGNSFVNNAVAGCQAQGRGYWMLGQGAPANVAGYPQFTGNRAHGCYNGLDTAPDAINNASNPYPLMPSSPPHTISGVAITPVIITSSTALPTGLSPDSVTVGIAGTSVLGPGPWPLTQVQDRTPPYSFGIESATITGPYRGGGTWLLSPMSIFAVTQTAKSGLITITVPPGIVVPPMGSQVIIAKVPAPGLAANGTWTVTASTPGSTPASLGSFTVNNPASTTPFAVPNGGNIGHWQLQGPITGVSAPSTVITTGATPAPETGTWVNIMVGQGADATTSLCKATNLGARKFSLSGANCNGDITTEDTWQIAPQAPVFMLDGNTVTRSRQRGFWGRSAFYTLHNNRFGTNPYGVSIAGGGGPEGNLPGYWGLAHENVFAGMTRNNVERYPACPNSGNNWVQECSDVTLSSLGSWGNYPSASMNIQGYSYYDGPARIEHNRFVNFRFDPTGIHPNDPAARLLTRTDIGKIATYGRTGQLEGVVTAANAGKNAAPSSDYQGYAGDPATGWIQSNAQSVPPTQYIRQSVWDNVDFKHQVYDASVNMGVFEDGDKTTVILDKDSQLSGLKVVTCRTLYILGSPSLECLPAGLSPVSLNNLAYYATDFTVDEPHSRGPNNFLQTSLMSPHRYATLNIESVEDPPTGSSTFRVEIKRDMPAYGDTLYPSLFLNGRGQKPIYEPFVMDRMGYTVYGKYGTENDPASQSPAAFQKRLLFGYTDPAVKVGGAYFVNRIAVYQPLTTPASIKMYRIRRQWGDLYPGAAWPPDVSPPGPAATSCDGVFFENQADANTRWQDCLSRGEQENGGVTLTPAKDWASFDKSYQDLLAGTVSVATFIAKQTFYYDTASSMLYFHMIEDQPVQQIPSPYGTCGGGKQQYAANVAQVQQIKNFSDPNSVKAALDAACLVADGIPQPTDLFTCGKNGCASYLVDLSAAGVGTPVACSPCTPPHPISRQQYSAWNLYRLAYGTPAQQANGLPVVANPLAGNTSPPLDGTLLTALKTPKSGTAPPKGDRVTYNFLSLSEGTFPVTENFPYRCVTPPPWSPVNARGTYPPRGGFSYPLHPSVCPGP